MTSSFLYEPLLNAYRKELERRYQLENLRRFSELSAIPKKKIDALRQFFLDYVYPPFSQRTDRVQALEALGGILRSPRKLWPVAGTALRAAGKLGKDIGPGLKAGFRSLDIYLKSLSMEKLMLIEAQKQSVNPLDLERKEILKQIVAGLPYKKVIQFQKDIVSFCSSLANLTLLEKSIGIMRTFQQVMEKKTNIYSSKERKGLAYGLAMLEAGYKLFCWLEPGEIELVLQGIRSVEEDWYFGLLQV